MTEVMRTTLTGGTGNLQADVVAVSSDPTKSGLVITNADGSAIGSAGAISKYIDIIDTTTSTTYIYFGKAVPGSLESEAKRSISRCDLTGPYKFLLADSGNFSQIWNNRTLLTYA